MHRGGNKERGTMAKDHHRLWAVLTLTGTGVSAGQVRGGGLHVGGIRRRVPPRKRRKITLLLKKILADRAADIRLNKGLVINKKRKEEERGRGHAGNTRRHDLDGPKGERERLVNGRRGGVSVASPHREEVLES